MYGNPFSTFLSSGVFLPTGREEILAEMAQVITLPQPDDREIHGLPGMGKSSLLRYVNSPAFIRDQTPNFMGKFAGQSYRLFIVYVAGWIESIHPYVLLYREFFRAYQGYYDRMLAEHPAIVLPSPPVGEIDDLDGPNAFSRLEPYLRRLTLAGIRPVILFDEFDDDLAYKRLDADETARLSSWKGYCSLIFATDRRLEDVNTDAKGSPLYKRLTQIAFRELLPDEAREFLAQILAREERTLPDEDIDCLVELAGGFPYLLILAGRALWDLRRRVGLNPQVDELATPLPDTVKPYLHERLSGEFQREFDQYLKDRPADHLRVLFELSREGTLSFDPATMTRQSFRLMGLEEYGLVDIDAEGRMRLFSPLFREFLIARAQQPAAPAAVMAAAENEPKNLTELQANLYSVFRNKPDEVLTFEELGRKVWGWAADRQSEATGDEVRKIRIAVSKLRRQLEESATGERITNMRGWGYRFESAR